MEKTILKIIDLLQDEHCSRMNKSNLKAYLGELIVKNRLEQEGAEVEHLGNQSGYDLKANNKIKIDVKYSSYNEKNFDWGWVLVPYSKKRKISCTHFVCVAMNDDFTIDAFYVIKAEDVDVFPESTGRFSVRHFFSAIKDNHKYPDKSFHNQCTKLLNDGIAKKIPLSGKLIETLM